VKSDVKCIVRVDVAVREGGGWGVAGAEEEEAEVVVLEEEVQFNFCSPSTMTKYSKGW